MILPVQITFRNVEPSPAVAMKIQAAAAKLDRYCDNITSCRVRVEAAHRHQQHGEPFNIRIDLRLPRHEIVIQREPSPRRVVANGGANKTTKRLEPNARHKDMYVAVADAFEIASRRLEDFVIRRRDRAKRVAKRSVQTPSIL